MKKNDAFVQILIVGFISFCCPGIFNAMQGLGGAGGKNPDAGNAANTALYATFAVCGYFGGPVFNALGNRWCMCLGGLCYAIYSVCMYIVGNVDNTAWVAPLGGAILGAGAGIFWTAQGGMMLAYSTPDNKGWYISVFWIIFNLGGVAGGLIAFGINFHEESGQANPALYFTFIGLMCVGALSSLILLANPRKVIKEDGSAVEVTPAGSAIEDIKGALLVATNLDMLLLFCTFLSSNWFYTYQLNYLNAFLFNIRTRGLNSTLYWAIQMAGAYVVGKILDSVKHRAKTNARNSYFLVQFAMIAFWAGSIAIQYGFEGGYDKDRVITESVDMSQSKRATGIIILFIISGFADSVLQAFSYWMIGGVARGDTTLTARYTGYYKGLQSAGAAVAWGLDLKVNYRIQMWIAIGIWALAALTCYPAVNRVADAEHAPKVEAADLEAAVEDVPRSGISA
ncbi:major facilitator family transporter [Gregarina niphandrodes]|uniref:Major facilitator family transporter n=1 Tax=Gregarina niphandrodes TaxID=110365 RepID=A0A023B8W2_GRENI|nr:major facilitator family transporter [Gregarina niphandrodes]EZG70563.1 major facilitator family transporter [Gregarina niphandrodes]|eukprot:XP_011129920.1 major facilitator family transporter [Gregarina niphandrodes]